MLAEVSLFNPRRKRKSRKSRKVKARSKNARRVHRAKRRAVGYTIRRAPVRRRKLNSRRARSVKRRHRARSRNPRFSVGGITSALIPAAIGGAGAVGLDVALGYGERFLPEMLTKGYGKVAVQVAGAFALGWAASKVVGKDKGKAVTAGALTVAAYSLIKTLTAQFAPQLPGLSGDDYADNVGAYMPELGYTNPAPFLQDDSVPSMGGVGAYMSDGM